MRFLRYLVLFCIAVISGTVNAQSQRELGQLMRNRGEYYFTLNVDDPTLIQIIGEICSVDGTDGRNIVAYANQQEYDKLLSLGLQPVLQTPPSLRQEAKMWEGGDRATYEWDSYLTYEQYVSMMESFPSSTVSGRTCTLIDLGQLTTSAHRHLLGVRINNGIFEGKPKFLYTSTMHGDEVTGMILMLRLIDELCTSTDSRILNLLNDVDIYIFPCTNPDGTYHGGNNTVTGAQRYNGNNIDLNRNYRDYFNGEHPDNKSYQNETLWTMALADENLFTMGANYHGGAEVMNYCWDWVFQDHADVDWWEYVCSEYVQQARQVNSSYMGGYNYGSNNYDYDGVTNGATWYSITGSRQDYMNAFGQCREVTVECSTTKTPSASQLPSFWNYNHNSMLTFMEQARNGVHGVVYDVVTGQTLQGVTVSVLNHDINNSYVTTHSVGDFHRPIKGGTYTFVFDKEGYAREFVEVTVADGQRVDLTVNLSPSSATPKACYEQVDAASIVTGPCLMGYRNGSTLIMPAHNNNNTTTNVTVTNTSLAITPTDNGFTMTHNSELQKIALEPSGINGQYHITYKGRMLYRSSSDLRWAKPSNSSGNGVDLSPYRWYVNSDGIYVLSGGTKYYLNYSGSSFTVSTTNQNNITIYREVQCPPEGYTVHASYDNLSGTVTFSSGSNSGTQLNGLEGGETVTVSVSTNEGYAFNSITATDSDNNTVDLVSNGNGSYSFSMPEADVTVTVAFDAIDYTVNVSSDINHGTMLVNGSASLCDAHAGQTINITATPDPGFELNTLFYIAEGTTTEVYITGNSFVMPASDITVYAIFARDCGGEVTYERVTEAPDDWSGTYLLVYQNSTTANSGYAFNGTVTGGDGYSTGITISGGTTINDLGNAAELTIEKISGSDYYYIKNGSNYLYAETTSLYQGSSASGSTYQWSLAMSGNYVNIHTGASTYQLYFNTNTSSSYYQRIYPASQNTTNLYLYRKTVNSSAATVSFSPASGTMLSSGTNTVTLISSIGGLPIYYTTDGTEPTMASAHATSPVILMFNDAVTVKAFVFDDPENDGCGIGATATATYGWAVPTCYDLVTSVSANEYVMGYLNGTTLVMPTHNNSSTVTTTSATVDITENGFSVLEDIPHVTLTAYGTNGQYYIIYNNRYLTRSSYSLTWSTSTSSNARWYINASGIYVTSSNRNYYLYYSNGSFLLSTTQQNNITFYTEGDCPIPTIQQSVTLYKGWNWWSTNLDITLGELMDVISAAVGTNGTVTIKSHLGSITYQDGQWNGNGIQTLDVRQMYEIQTSVSCEITLTGVRVNPASYVITIHNGNNWIGYLPVANMTLSEAFGTFPVEGDVVKSSTGSAVYENGQWIGQLSVLQPGQGYIYKSIATGDRIFTFPSNEK